MATLNEILPLIDAALAEDVGSGDATSLATVPGDLRAEGEILAKENGVICGLFAARAVFERVDPQLRFEADVRDGESVASGRVVARVAGSARSILTGERTALNFLQHICGIATAAAKASQLLEGTGTRILDTRKTIPGMRLLAKYAVRCGGGTNHRMGLYDMILIKENHVTAAGGITAAIRRARERYPSLPLEVEVTTLDELEEALSQAPDRVLLDNFEPDQVRAAVARIGGDARRPEVELSGGITLENLREFALEGVDYISSGALTHSARALDLSLELRLLGPEEGGRCP